MITFAILILIVAKALPGLNTHISSIHVTRITSIVFLFAGALTLNSLSLESIGSGIGIYSGFFQVTTISQLIEIFLFVIGGGILIAWPQNKHNYSFTPSSTAKAGIAIQRDNGALAASPLLLATRLGFGTPLTDYEFYYKNKNKNEAVLGASAIGTDYSLVVLFSSLGSSLLISSYDLISIYLSIELQSFGLYVLSTLYREKESSTSAGLKYFLLGGLSSCIILLGTGIIYSYTGTTNLESLYIINSVIDINQQYIIQGISLGLSLIFIGFLFKIAAAPLHNWSPDVYDGTPTIVTTWLTIIPKIAILFILLELQVKIGAFGPLGSLGSSGGSTIIVNNSGYLLNLNQINEFMRIIFTTPFGDNINIVFNNNILKFLLLISATLSLIIGSLLGLAQIRIKRLLAYSTISHLGFILLALAVNTEQSIDSFIFYIIQYTITNLNIFLVILGLTYCYSTEVNKDISFISEFKGLFFKYPLLSLSLAVSLFSMAGIPPLIGFFSKQLVLYSALQNGYYFISVVAIIVSVISCSYYLQIIKVLFTPPLPKAGDASLFGSREDPASEDSSPYAPPSSLQLALDLEVSKSYPPLHPKGSLRQREGNEEQVKLILTNTHSYLISILTFTILFFFIKPSLILNSTQLLSLSLFYI
jgi:NADH-ubiquinone oxidoreductase chain 2